MSEVPLARLFALAFNDLIEGLHERLEARGWTDVRRPYGFVLLALRDGEASTTELSKLLRVSKQATSKLLEAMEAGGYVERRTGDGDARLRLVSLAPRGRELLDVVESIYAELEAEWAEVIGADALDTVRSAVTEVVEHRHDGVLPPISAP